jgi:hypothetical protein
LRFTAPPHVAADLRRQPNDLSTPAPVCCRAPVSAVFVLRPAEPPALQTAIMNARIKVMNNMPSTVSPGYDTSCCLRADATASPETAAPNIFVIEGEKLAPINDLM